MGRKLPYPPCTTNPMTEVPYSRHKWFIPAGAEAITKRGRNSVDLVYYRVRCKRCGFNDPNAPTY